MISKYSLFLLLIGSGAFAKSYIIGGQEVVATDPIQASTIGIFDPSPDGRSGALCTGTLIRKDMVVTAAHCLSNSGRNPTLIFGPDLHSPMATRREAEAVAINPKWKTNAGKGMDQGDIAIVKFAGGLPRGYKAVPTLSADKDIKAGAEVTLAGYGISNAQTKTGSGKLRRTEVSILKNRIGKSEMILDQAHGRGACHGDSGGPAFLRQGRKLVLAGVTNRGYPAHAPDDCAHQVVYTKLPAYRSWIKKSEKELAEAPSKPIRFAKNMKVTKRSIASRRVMSRQVISRKVINRSRLAKTAKFNANLQRHSIMGRKKLGLTKAAHHKR